MKVKGSRTLSNPKAQESADMPIFCAFAALTEIWAHFCAARLFFRQSTHGDQQQRQGVVAGGTADIGTPDDTKFDGFHGTAHCAGHPKTHTTLRLVFRSAGAGNSGDR